jgi:hypothetical protein
MIFRAISGGNMRYVLVLFFLLPNTVLADVDRTISKQRLFKISCERGALSFFMDYGNGSVTNKEFLKNTTKMCSSMVQNVTRKEWQVMSSPTESGCSSAINFMAQANKGIPETTQLFAVYCVNE